MVHPNVRFHVLPRPAEACPFAGPTFVGLDRGDIDLFFDAWLPSTHASYVVVSGIACALVSSEKSGVSVLPCTRICWSTPACRRIRRHD